MKKNHLMSFASEKAHDRIRRIHAALVDRPMRAAELCVKVGISRKAIHLYLDHLSGQIHVAGTVSTYGQIASIYAWGPRPGVTAGAPNFPPPVARRNSAPSAPAQQVAGHRQQRIARACYFKPQPARRSADVAMLFGAVR